MNIRQRRNKIYMLFRRKQNRSAELFGNTELLGFIFNYAGQVVDYLKDNFGDNVLNNLGLTEAQTKKAAEIIAGIYQLNSPGYKRGTADAKAVRDLAAKNLNWNSEALQKSLLKLILFLDDIKANNEPLLNDWLAGKVGIMSHILDFTTGAKNLATNITEGAKDTIKETGQVLTRSASAALDIANENLPFYLKPKIIIPGAAALILLMYLPKKKNT